MYWFVFTNDQDVFGPYVSSLEAQRILDGLDVGGELFESEYRNSAKAKQAYRAKHPEFLHRNFRSR